jgi:uncharacterized protein with beta-barrel porin domain
LRRAVWRTAAIAAILIGILLSQPALAQSATWLAAPTVTNPADGNFDFNANANWNPTTAPGSMTQTGTATFGMSAGTNISFSAGSTTLDGFTFTAAASNYAFFTNANVLNFVGAGIAINGGSANFANSNGGTTQLFNASTAGSAGITNNSGGLTFFGQSGGADTSSAGTATITNNSAGRTFFFASTTAGSAAITNSGGLAGAAFTFFNDTSTAGNAHITNNSDSETVFSASSTAGGATITNNSNGFTNFGQPGGTDTSTAGTAKITNNSGGGTQFSASTTAGSATITNNGGSTVFINASTASSAAITNSNSGAVQFGVFGGTDTSTAGNATITNNGGGMTTFNANTTAGSASITNNSFGLTQFFASSSAGGATITNNVGGATQFGLPGGTDTASAGNAVITNNGGGMTTFNANSTAGSATIAINGSSLQFFDTSTAGNAAITNSSNGLIVFFNANSAGSATIANNASGIEFQSTSTAGSATIVNNGGGLRFFNTSTAGNATITNNNGVTSFVNASTAGIATITNNGGSIQFGGPGGAGTASAGSATITNNDGFTEFFAHTTAANATLTNNSGTVAFFDQSDGGSAVITNNSGATSFVNASTAGSATITNNGGFTEFFAHTTAANATITNNSGTVAFFDQSDGGSAHLINGAGGTIDFSGSTGPLGNNQLNVGSLAGTGIFIVGQQQRVNVSGSLAFTSGALYLVQVQGSSASQIAVAGTATLAGTVEVDVTSRLTQATTYTILTSSGRGGTTFGTATLEFANSFASNPVLSYVGGNVLLTLQPGLLSPALPANASTNQVKVAGAIDNGLLAGNGLTNAFSAIFNLSGNGLLNGLTQISGETATGSQQTTFDAMGLFMGLLTDPFMNRGGGLGGSSLSSGYAEEDGQASAYAASKKTDAFAMFTKAPPQTFEPRWSVWASGFGGSQSTSGNAAVGSNNTTSNIAATVVGADYLFSPNTIAGFALAGGGTSFNVANGGTGRSDLFQLGAYVRHTSGAAYITGALAYGWQDITTNHTVMVGGLDQLRAEFNANAWSGRLEGGYRFVTPVYNGLGVTPYAAAQFVTFDLPAYAEQAAIGLNTFALSYGARDVTDSRTELGIRTDKSWAMSDGILALRGRLAWAHDFDLNRSIAATFQTLPAASFVVNGAAQASESALTTASIEMKWKTGWSAAATFEGEFSGVTNSYAGKGVVRYAW